MLPARLTLRAYDDRAYAAEARICRIRRGNMAKIVLGIGSSHGPSIQTPPEGWPMLGEGDPRDPRMDYEALLKAAPPELADELTPEKHSARHAAAHAAIGTLKDKITDARPDVLVVMNLVDDSESNRQRWLKFFAVAFSENL